MSKLDELIAQLCPDGVEYKTIDNISKVLRGKRLTKNLLSEIGDYPVFHGGLSPLGYYDKSNRESNTAMVINVGASAGTVGFSSVDFWSSDGCYCIEHSPQIISRYLYYALTCQEEYIKSRVRYAGIPTLDAKVVESLVIPVPPLPVQSEIVRILDNFTELTAELTTELTAELSARKKQYEYYMERLLNSKDDVPMETLGEIFSTVTDYVAAGSFASIAENVSYKSKPDYAQLVRTMDIKSSFTKGSNVYVDENAFKFLWRVNLNEESIIMPNIGVNCGEVYFVTPQDLPYDNNVLGPNAILLRSEKYNNKYLFYLLKTNTFQKALKIIISPGGQTKFNKTELKKLKLQIPSLEKQNRIVALLEQFDTLCNDIFTGLSAEIEARTKQYEHYRDKLLIFKKLS